MGVQYSKLKELRKPQVSSTIHNSLSKIRDYYGAFKSICDTFAISIVEYEQIFGNSDAFTVWDSDKNGVIDALEMFTGLILFSDARAEDKLKGDNQIAMFELYDFNEIRTISKTDLEFMLYCCISSALKLYGYADDCPQDKTIRELVLNSLSKSSRVSLNELLHFCAFSEDINNFLYFFKIKSLSLPKPQKKMDVFEPLRDKGTFPLKIPKFDVNVQKKIESSSRSWIGAVHNPISKMHESKDQTGKFSLHWVLGIKAEGSRHNIGIVQGNDIILYFVSSVVVILYCRLLKQKHYLEHTSEIMCITLGKDIACTGESGPFPRVHVWRINTLETLQILHGVHQSSITLLGFTNNEQHLVTCSTFTVVIYEWKTKNILVTTNHIFSISDLYLLPRVSASSCFILGSDEEITVYSIEKERLNVATVNIQVSMCRSPIACVTGQGIYDMKNENSFILLTGHNDGSVLLWECTEFQRIVVEYESSISALQVIVNWYAIATGLGMIYIWDSRLENCAKVIEISMFTFKLLSFEIISLQYVNKKFYISTKGGDIVEARIQLDNLKITPKRIGGIIQIPDSQTHIVFLSMKLPFLVTAGTSGVITTIDLRSYEIIDTWAVGYYVHCMRCEKFDEDIISAVGCEEGKLFIRENWDLTYQPEAGHGLLTDLEFVKDGKILIVASEDKNLYIFKKSANFEKIFMIPIENSVPISMTSSEDKSNVLIVTDKRKLMMMNAETYELNFTFDDVSNVSWKKLHTYFYASLKENFFKVPVVWNRKGDCLASGGFEGINVWNQANKVKMESGYLLKGHIGTIIDLSLKSSLLFTLGVDRMIMYWTYEKVTLVVDDAPLGGMPGILTAESDHAHVEIQEASNEKQKQFIQSAFLSTAVETSPYFFAIENSNKSALVALGIKNIYGGRVNLRKSLYYIHIHTNEDSPSCTRHLLYFASRYAVLFNPVAQSQSFYTNHRYKITALDIHPTLELAATCELNMIHVWKIREKVQVSKLVSSLHALYIVKFGNQKQGGEVLAVIGWEDDLPGLEIFDWSHEFSLSRIMLYNIPQDIAFHPTEFFRIVICGENFFSVWKRSGCVLKCKSEVKLQKILTVMKFLTFKQRKEIDLLIGTSQGELLISVESRLLVHVEAAHEGAVLCISTTEFQGLSLIFTGGEDGFVRIWTHALMPVNKFHISSITDSILVLSKPHQISNIQVYTCYAKKPFDSTLPKGAKQEPLVLSIGTEGGALLEVSLTNISSSEQITLQYKVYFENHCEGVEKMRKSLFALHPDIEIMASIGEDRILRIWQYDNYLCIASKELDNAAKPCSIQFSCTGILAVGMENGVVLFLSSRDNMWGFGAKSEFDMSVSFTIRESNAAVLCVVFSRDAEYLAISYDNVRGISRFGESSGLKTGGADMTTGFVVLYILQENGMYKKVHRVSLPFGNIKDIASYPPRNECAVTSIEFSDDNLYVALFHQKVNSKEHIPDNKDYRPLLVIWDILSASMIENFESVCSVVWSSSIINSMMFSSIRPPDINVLTNSFSEEQMIFIVGDSEGFIYISRNSALAVAYSQKLKYSKNLGLDLQSSSRKYLAHTSAVLSTKWDGENFFSTAFDESCIIQWTVTYENPNWELDYTDFQTTADPFCETLPIEAFNKIFTETWMPQSEISIKLEKSMELTLETCIGRRARDRRNNLGYDSEERIVYTAGNNLIMHNKETNTQVFLQYNNRNKKINLAEISCFCISADKRNVFIGTSDIECRIMLWDLYAYVMIFSLPIPDGCIVHSLNISNSCRYIASMVLHKSYQQVLYLIQISSDMTPTIIAFTPIVSICTYKIKEICISELNGLEIYTCGLQHFVKWRVHSTVFHNYPIALPENTILCLLCIKFISNIIITAADDGKIYVWHEDNLFRSVPGHDGCILSLEINEELGIGVTGGVDGHIIVWKIAVSGSGDELQVQLDSLREYSLQDPNAYGFAYAVQGLSVGSFIQDQGFKVLIGTQNGDIYELAYEVNADLDALSKVSAAIDAQNILALSCDVTSSYLFTLSAGGIFAMWDIHTFSQTYTYDFHKPGVKLYVFHRKSFDDTDFEGKRFFIVISFEDEILLIKLSEGETVEHEVLDEFTLETSNLTDMKVSTEEKYLALASNKDQKPHVDIYLIKSHEFVMDKNLFGFRAPVVRLDYSTDGYYLMCEDNLGEVLLFELETQNIASFHSVEFEIEWLNEGLRHSTGLKSIHQLYNINNKIACITKSPGLSVLAIGDEYGVIALYQLPYVPGSSLIMVPGHSYKINLICFSPDDKFLITYSELDRCILKWKIQGQ